MNVQNMSDTQLVSLFIPKTKASTLLKKHGSIRQLICAESESFYKLQAALELSKRHIEEALKQKESLSSPKAVYEYLALNLRDKLSEHFIVLFLDNHNRLIASENLFTGTVNQATIYPRVIVRQVIKYNAAAVILAHNHPSGYSKPSQNDIDLTKVIQNVLKVIDVTVLDHIVIGDNEYSSFKNDRLI